MPRKRASYEYIRVAVTPRPHEFFGARSSPHADTSVFCIDHALPRFLMWILVESV